MNLESIVTVIVNLSLLVLLPVTTYLAVVIALAVLKGKLR